MLLDFLKGELMKKKQIIFLFLLILLLLVCFSNKSFAFTCKSPTNGKTYVVPNIDTLPSEAEAYVDNGYLIRTWNDGSKDIVTLELFYSDFTYLYLHTNKDSIVIPNHKTISVNLGDTSWSNGTLKNAVGSAVPLSRFIYSSVDIYSDVDKSSVFMKAPPKPVLGVVQAKVEQVEMRAVLQEVVGILPVILSVLVSLIALRKGWSLLLNILRRA